MTVDCVYKQLVPHPTNHPTTSPSLSVQPPCVCDCAARIVSCYCIHPPSQPAGKAMRGPVQTYLNRGQACGGLSADHQPSCAQHVITSRPLTTYDTRFSISGLATSPAPQTSLHNSPARRTRAEVRRCPTHLKNQLKEDA